MPTVTVSAMSAERLVNRKCLICLHEHRVSANNAEQCGCVVDHIRCLHEATESGKAKYPILFIVAGMEYVLTS